jgi:hypothetical protein
LGVDATLGAGGEDATFGPGGDGATLGAGATFGAGGEDPAFGAAATLVWSVGVLAAWAVALAGSAGPADRKAADPTGGGPVTADLTAPDPAVPAAAGMGRADPAPSAAAAPAAPKSRTGAAPNTSSRQMATLTISITRASPATPIET